MTADEIGRARELLKKARAVKSEEEIKAIRVACTIAEMGMKAARMNLRMLDIPITYRPRIGQTKLHSLKAGYEHIKLIVTLLFWKPSDGMRDD